MYHLWTLRNLFVWSRLFHPDLQRCHSSMIRKVLKDGMVWVKLNVVAAVISVRQTSVSTIYQDHEKTDLSREKKETQKEVNCE